MRSGVKDLRRMPVLVTVLFLVVGLATFLALLSPALDEAVEVGGVEIVADSEVIVFLSLGMSGEEVSQAETELSEVRGVDLVRPATADDIAATRRGYEVGSDISHVRTLVLDGTGSQESVVFSANGVVGVDRADAGLGERVGWVVPLLRTVVPWLTALFALAGMLLVVNVVFAAARSRRDEAEVMRLLGASWLAMWLSLGTVVLVPVFIATIATTLLVAIVWPSVLQLISPRSINVIPTSAVFGNGMWLTVLSTLVVIGVSQLGLLASRQQS